jgi:pimeloyl-ACP methyl ester carboxylesterase
MTKPKPTRKQPVRPTSATRPSAFEKAMHDMQHQPPTAFPNVSPLWLLKAAAVAFLAALALAWLALCLLYWQGSWQLLYHPKTEITRTPASTGLAFEAINFSATETGVTQLAGWWLPNANASHTILYLHGADGNLSDTVDALAALHAQNLSIFAIDYRGYGKSLPMQAAGRPNEKHLRQDAEWALTWLTLTRSIPAKSIVIYGSGLGANVAAELAADHSELAGIILDQPSQNALAPIFNDPRSRLVPAHWLVEDRYDLFGPATRLKLPSLWLLPQSKDKNVGESRPWITPVGPIYDRVPGQKLVAWVTEPAIADPHFSETLHRWLDDLN